MGGGGYSSDEGLNLEVKSFSRKVSDRASSKNVSRSTSQQDCGKEEAGPSEGSPRTRRKSWLENAASDIKSLSLSPLSALSRRKSAATRVAGSLSRKGSGGSGAPDSSDDSFGAARDLSFNRRKSAPLIEGSRAQSHSEKLPLLRAPMVPRRSNMSAEMPDFPPPLPGVIIGGSLKHSHSALDPPTLPGCQDDDAEFPAPPMRRAMTARRRRMSIPSAPNCDPATGEVIEIPTEAAVADEGSPSPEPKPVHEGIQQPRAVSAAALTRQTANLSLEAPSAASASSAVTAATAAEIARQANQDEVLRILKLVKGCQAGRSMTSKEQNQVQTLLTVQDALFPAGLCSEPSDPVRRLDSS